MITNNNKNNNKQSVSSSILTAETIRKNFNEKFELNSKKAEKTLLIYRKTSNIIKEREQLYKKMSKKVLDKKTWQYVDKLTCIHGQLLRCKKCPNGKSTCCHNSKPDLCNICKTYFNILKSPSALMRLEIYRLYEEACYDLKLFGYSINTVSTISEDVLNEFKIIMTNLGFRVKVTEEQVDEDHLSTHSEGTFNYTTTEYIVTVEITI